MGSYGKACDLTGRSNKRAVGELVRKPLRIVCVADHLDRRDKGSLGEPYRTLELG